METMQRISMLLVSAIFLGLFSQPVIAANKLALKVAPAYVAMPINKNNFYKKQFIVVNTGEQKAKIDIKMQDFAVDSRGRARYISRLDTKRDWSAATWLRFKQGGFVLKPGEERKIWLLIEPPPHASAGTHRAAIKFVASPFTGTKSDKKISVGVSVISMVLVDVEGKIINRPYIKIDVPKVNFSAPKLDLTVGNAGNTYFFSLGKVRVYKDKEQMSRLQLKTPVFGSLILPKTKRDFSVLWKRAPYSGFFTAKAEITLSNKKKLIAQKSFYVIRWQPLSGGLALILLAVFVYMASKKIKIVRR